MRVLQLPNRFPYYAQQPTIVGSDFAALVDDALRVFDVRGTEARVVHELEGVMQIGVARGADDFVALDNERGLTRWQRSVDRWVASVRVNLPELPGGNATIVSPSGRFAYVDGKRGCVIDLDRERVVTRIEADDHTARACFERLPDGREVLLVATPDSTSIRMIDPATGDVLAGHEEQSSHDFRHEELRLARGASRLVTYGCLWGCRDQVMICDASPWTGVPVPGAVSAPADAFPLPIVRHVWSAAKAAHVDDGLADLSCVGLENRRDLTPRLLEHFRADEPALVERLEAFHRDGASDDSHVLIVRRIDLRDGSTRSASVHAIPDVSHRHIHYARGHRVVVAGPRLQVFNADDDRVEDHGTLRLGDRARTAVTADGETLIVVDAVSPT